jgi:hypothetical protein
MPQFRWNASTMNKYESFGAHPDPHFCPPGGAIDFLSAIGLARNPGATVRADLALDDSRPACWTIPRASTAQPRARRGTRRLGVGIDRAQVREALTARKPKC